MVSTVIEFGMGVVRALSLARCSSSWCRRRFRMSSTLVCHGNFFTLMTWCSSQTPRRSVSSSSRCGRLAWKAKGSMSTWKRPSSWSLVMVVISLRNLASTPVQLRPVFTVYVWVHKKCSGITKRQVAAKTMSATGVTVSLCPLLAELLLKWMSTAPCLMWKSLFVT